MKIKLKYILKNETVAAPSRGVSYANLASLS